MDEADLPRLEALSRDESETPRHIVPLPDALVTIGATEQQSLDEGKTSLANIRSYGMSSSWHLRGKKMNGYCHVNGKGTITAFKQGL